VTPAFPGTFLLTADVSAIQAYLASVGWLVPNEVVERVTRAGEGNMNCVLQAVTYRRSFILKQSRPWVEKYPGVAAPWDRALVEARFYREVEPRQTIANYLPKLLDVDSNERLLMLEDLGEAQDFTFLYSDGGTRLEEAECNNLIDFLVALHTSLRGPELADAFPNMEMRLLNHEHVFALPLRKDNGLDLDAITPGLSALAIHLQAADPAYCGEVRTCKVITFTYSKWMCYHFGHGHRCSTRPILCGHMAASGRTCPPPRGRQQSRRTRIRGHFSG